MHLRRPIKPRGFSLLEAVLALAIIAAALIAVLQVRTQMIRGAQQARDRQAVERDDEAVFQMLIAGLLPAPTSADGVVTWQGEFLDRPYIIQRTIERIPNPNVDELDHPVRPTLSLITYTLTIDERTTVFPWYE